MRSRKIKYINLSDKVSYFASKERNNEIVVSKDSNMKHGVIDYAVGPGVAGLTSLGISCKLNDFNDFYALLMVVDRVKSSNNPHVVDLKLEIQQSYLLEERLGTQSSRKLIREFNKFCKENNVVNVFSHRDLSKVITESKFKLIGTENFITNTLEYLYNNKKSLIKNGEYSFINLNNEPSLEDVASVLFTDGERFNYIEPSHYVDFRDNEPSSLFSIEHNEQMQKDILVVINSLKPSDIGSIHKLNKILSEKKDHNIYMLVLREVHLTSSTYNKELKKLNTLFVNKLFIDEDFEDTGNIKSISPYDGDSFLNVSTPSSGLKQAYKALGNEKETLKFKHPEDLRSQIFESASKDLDMNTTYSGTIYGSIDPQEEIPDKENISEDAFQNPDYNEMLSATIESISASMINDRTKTTNEASDINPSSPQSSETQSNYKWKIREPFKESKMMSSDIPEPAEVNTELNAVQQLDHDYDEYSKKIADYNSLKKARNIERHNAEPFLKPSKSHKSF